MRYCYACGGATWGEPRFCNFCGASYDVRLCPRLHVNSRIAKICRECGSHELSTPQPKVSFFWKVLAYVVRVVLGALLVWLSLAIAVPAIRELLNRPEVQGAMICLALLLVGLWFLWAMLPEWMRRFIRKRIERKEHHRDH
jgi:hypothetical protein